MRVALERNSESRDPFRISVSTLTRKTSLALPVAVSQDLVSVGEPCPRTPSTAYSNVDIVYTVSG